MARKVVRDDSVYRDFDRQTRMKRCVRDAMANMARPYKWADDLYGLFVAAGVEGLEPSGYDIIYSVRQIDRGEEAAIIELLTDLYLETVGGEAVEETDEDEEQDPDIEYQ